MVGGVKNIFVLICCGGNAEDIPELRREQILIHQPVDMSPNGFPEYLEILHIARDGDILLQGRVRECKLFLLNGLCLFCQLSEGWQGLLHALGVPAGIERQFRVGKQGNDFLCQALVSVRCVLRCGTGKSCGNDVYQNGCFC